ncbi:MAG: hypothetical protein ACQESG_07455 [Nanobdellota archaeon]
MKNYYELVRNLSGHDPDTVGRTITKGVLENASDHLDLYFNQYVKEFQNKENNRVFNSLERLTEVGLMDASDPELTAIYTTVSRKTTQVVRQINFVYDAINFFAARRNLTDFFPVLQQQISQLGSASVAREVRGLGPNSPKYHFEKAEQFSKEYERFVVGLRNYLRKTYNVPLR